MFDISKTNVLIQSHPPFVSGG